MRRLGPCDTWQRSDSSRRTMTTTLQLGTTSEFLSLSSGVESNRFAARALPPPSHQASSTTAPSRAAHSTATATRPSTLLPTMSSSASRWTLRRSSFFKLIHRCSHQLSHHYLTVLLGGKLFLAPIGDHAQVCLHHPAPENPADSSQSVLDIGTGTGTSRSKTLNN